MADLDRNPYIVNLLRVGAILGVLLTGLGKVLSEEPLQPNQHYSFIALALVSLAVTVALFVFLPGTTLRILKNPDLLVPLGLYITADEIVGRLAGHAGFGHG